MRSSHRNILFSLLTKTLVRIGIDRRARQEAGIVKRILYITVFLILSYSQVFAQRALTELKISAIPDENPQEMLRIYQPFAEYLSKEIGIPVKFTPVVDYAATVEGLVANKLDMVWYGGLTSVQAARMAKGAKRIVMRREDTAFKSQFITRKDTGIHELKDLKGKTFTFGSVSSTSGHLMPRFYLLKAGVNPEKDFSKFSFSGAHDTTAAWVETGRFDAGALNFLCGTNWLARRKSTPTK